MLESTEFDETVQGTWHTLGPDMAVYFYRMFAVDSKETYLPESYKLASTYLDPNLATELPAVISQWSSLAAERDTVDRFTRRSCHAMLGLLVVFIITK